MGSNNSHKGGKIDSSHKEGSSATQKKDGTVHETKWYDTGQGSSARTSCDYDKDGNESDKHTTKQK